ncbi:MAG: nucleotidyltransferase domain-containing protein [Verrucomicrobia bacterium]|nr:nucleotidyltransferase domain-containing protein [Verrucomicrobiota bacterium]
MAFGLTEKDIELIRSAIEAHSEIEEVVVFGSRARGNHKNGSDVDLAVKGNRVSLRTISRLGTQLNEELPLPYQFDVIDYASIDTRALTEHIDSFGKVLFQRKASATEGKENETKGIL